MSISTQKTYISWVKRHSIFCAILFALSLNFFTSQGFATWRRIAQFEVTVNCSFFFNEQRGFIGLDGHHGILRTSDGGATWINCITPNPTAYFGFISDIFMKDSLNGWATIEDDVQSHGLWYTTDGGVNWLEQFNVQSSASCVYQTSAAVIFGSRYSITALSINIWLGLGTFSRTVPGRFDGINFTDDKHGVLSAMSTGNANGTFNYYPAYYTGDGGLTWNQTQGIFTEGWGVYAEKGTSNFVIAGEKSAADNNNWENIYASSDYGANWKSVSQLPGRTTGHVAGVGSVIYVQSSSMWNFPNSPDFIGLYRSTDRGVTWQSVGGPANYRDTRFSVAGCLGAVVYAFDESGGVWKTTDGGDGEIHEPPHNPNITPNHVDLSSDMCHYSLANLSYTDFCCYPLHIESIGFVDSTDPLISTGALSFTHYPTSFPDTLNPTQNDYLTLSWQPAKYGVQKPLSTTYIKIHSTMLDGTIVLDTLIPVNSQSFAFVPSFSLSASNVKFDSLNICNALADTIISYTNESCDTLWLDSAILAGTGDWQVSDPSTLQPLILPIGLAPNESSNFLIRFVPSATGSQKANIKLQFTHQGLVKDTSLFFTGSAFRIFSVAADAAVSLAPLSICKTFDTSVSLYNRNCDTLTIDNILNSNPAVFSDLSGIVVPYKLPPAATLTYKVRYNPIKNVSSNADITFTYHLEKDSGVSVSHLNGKGIPGSSMFVSSDATSQLLFADRTACSGPDSLVFTIDNPGCDTLKVTSSTLSALGLPAITYKTEPPLPAVLVGSNNSIRIVVYLQAENPSINNGTLNFSYQTSDGVSHDSLFQIQATVNPGVRAVVLSHDNIDMGTGSLCNQRDTEIVVSNPNCPKLTVEKIDLSGNYFILQNPRPTPFDLAMGENDTIKVSFIPTASGSQGGTLTVTTNAEKNPIHVIPLTASTRDIDHISFRLVELNTSPLIAGDTAFFGFIPDRDWSGEGLQKIDFSIVSNADLLTWDKNIQQSDGTFSALATEVSLPGNISQLNVHISSPNEIVLHKDKPLVKFHYATALTDTLTTPVTLTLLSLNDADPHYLNCVLTPQSIDGDFVLNLECGGKTLIDFLHGTMPILAGEAHPNPVTSSTNYQAEIPFTTSVTGLGEFSFYDALGKKIASNSFTIDRSGMHSIHFDAQQIAGGTYQYIIMLGGTAVRGRLIVLK